MVVEPRGTIAKFREAEPPIGGDFFDARRRIVERQPASFAGFGAVVFYGNHRIDMVGSTGQTYAPSRCE